MTKQGSIDRGEKWTRVRAESVFQNRNKDVEWIDKTPCIVSDMKMYEDSLKKPKVVLNKPKVR